MSTSVPRWGSGDLFEYPVAEQRVEAARAQAKGGGVLDPVEPTYAATVMLVRDAVGNGKSRFRADAHGAVEVFMLHRAKTMAFVPDAVVFPGGSVDIRDSDPGLPWAGPSPEAWAERMGCEVDVARRVVVAAAREVFEECGVLLAGPDGESVIDDLTDDVWRERRKNLSSHTTSFAELLIDSNLVLRSDLLGVRARWVTPAFEPKRYDTFFFSALLPTGQIPDDRTSEATDADWVDPVWLFDRAESGSVLLLPPTRYNLSFIERARSAETFVADRPPVKRIMLQPVICEDGKVLLRCRLP